MPNRLVPKIEIINEKCEIFLLIAETKTMSTILNKDNKTTGSEKEPKLDVFSGSILKTLDKRRPTVEMKKPIPTLIAAFKLFGIALINVFRDRKNDV